VGGRITALKIQKRNTERVNVYIDDRFAFGLAAVEVIHLKVGQELSDAEIAHLKQKDQVQVAYERSLKFLSYRPRAVAEIQRYLDEKGFDEPTREEVVARLSQAGLLDDDAFARYWIENRDTFKPRGRRALRYELRQKGVPGSVIDRALMDYDEGDAAHRAAFARAQKLARHHDFDALRPKLLAFLSRRGFSFPMARDTVESILDELTQEQADTKG
jgi:regulatory protein